MYAMVCVRLDLAHVVSIVSRYMANLERAYWEAVERVLQYHLGTQKNCLVIGGTNVSFVGFSNSDYAGDLDKRRSITTNVFTIEGTTVIWKTKLQSTIVLSTTKAEYIAVTKEIKEEIWLGNLVKEFTNQKADVIVHNNS